MHFYRLSLTAEEGHEELNRELLGDQFTSHVREPQEHLSEAAKAIPVPSWWKGGTTASTAMLLADKLKGKAK